MSNDVQHDEQWSRMSFDMDHLLGTLPTDPVILRFIDDVRWLRAQLMESEATLATIGGADKATLARKLRRANAATRDAEQGAKRLEDALDTIHRRVFSLAHDYVTLAETRQEANSLYRDMRETIFAPMKARRAALTAPATQPDEWAAAERAVVAAAIADRRHFNECDACQDETCQIGAEYTCRLAEACDALLALDATDGAAKEGA